MKSAAVRLIPLSVCLLVGCGGSGGSGGSGSLEGKWRGTAAGINVEANIENDIGGAIQGVLTLSNPTCFNNGRISGSHADTSVQMAARGSGTASQTTYSQLTGEHSGDTITGTFSMTGSVDECMIPQTAITLSR